MALALAVLGSLLFSGCGNGGLKSEFEQTESVIYSQTTRIRGLDPAVAGEVSSSMAIARIYEGLLEYDYLARPYKVKPLLAEAMPEISADGLTYTFKIRKGIYFQDDPCFPNGKGRELVAEDFIYQIKRVMDVKNVSSGGWAFSNRIKGIDGFHEASKSPEPTDYDQTVEGLQSLDKYTLRISLVEPYPQLLYVLAMHYSFAVPREAVEFYGKAIVNHPVGTGPYKLVSWRRNSRIEFARNPKWAETGRVETFEGQAFPSIDRVVQYVVDDSSTAWMMFLSGQLSFSAISRDNWAAVITGDKQLNDSLATRGIELISSPTLDLYYVGFNMDDPVVGTSDDPEQDLRHRKLRQALSCAYDFDRMNQFMNYRLYPLGGPVPEPLAGSLKKPSPYRFNLEKASRLLVEAGYPDGIDGKTGRRLELTMELGSADANTRQSMELIADMFQKVGIVMKANYNTWPAFIEKMNRRQAQMFQLGWVADYPDAENFLQLFYSKNETPGPNHANYRNAVIDRQYEQIRTMQDSPERTAIYEEMSNTIVEDCPWIYMYQPMSFALKHCWVENYVPHDFPYGMGKYYRVDEAVRRAWRKSYGETKLNISGRE